MNDTRKPEPLAPEEIIAQLALLLDRKVPTLRRDFDRVVARYAALAVPAPASPAILGIAKKAAEYGRSGRWNDDLAIALSRLDAAIAWDDPERGNGTAHSILDDASRPSAPASEPDRDALVDALRAIRVRGEAAALSGQHVHHTDADLADLILMELRTRPSATASGEPRADDDDGWLGGARIFNDPPPRPSAPVSEPAGCTHRDLAGNPAHVQGCPEAPWNRPSATASGETRAEVNLGDIRVSPADVQQGQHRAAPWLVRLTCCGRADGVYAAMTRDDAEAFREAYTSGPGVRGTHVGDTGHDRTAVIEDALAALPVASSAPEVERERDALADDEQALFEDYEALRSAAMDVWLQRAERRAGGGLVLTSRTAMERLGAALQPDPATPKEAQP